MRDDSTYHKNLLVSLQRACNCHDGVTSCNYGTFYTKNKNEDRVVFEKLLNSRMLERYLAYVAKEND